MKRVLWFALGVILAYATVCLYFAFKTYPYSTVSGQYELDSPNGQYKAVASCITETSWWNEERFLEFDLHEKNTGNSLRKMRWNYSVYDIDFTNTLSLHDTIRWTEDSNEVSFSLWDTTIKINLDTPYKYTFEALKPLFQKNEDEKKQ